MEETLQTTRATAVAIAEFARGQYQVLDSIRGILSKVETPSPKHDSVQRLLEDDPLITARQKELLWHWELFGVIGLAYWIKKIAIWERDDERKRGVGVSKRKRTSTEGSDEEYEQSPGGHSTWTKLIDDLADLATSRSMYYLSSIPPEVMAGLIRGDLPRRMQDGDFRDKWGPYLKCKRSQGAYIVQVVRILPRVNETNGDSGQSAAATSYPRGVTCSRDSLPDSGVGCGFTRAELQGRVVCRCGKSRL